jgi:long-chain acyl-CoA synthetase
MPADTIPARLMKRARGLGDAPAYHVKDGASWRATSWAAYSGEVRRAARALIALGFKPGNAVCILGFNRPDWAVLDLASMCAGGAPAGIYTTCSPTEVQYIVHHTEAPVVLVENHVQWEKIKKERERLPALRHVVLMRGAPPVDDPLVMGWDAFLGKGDGVPETELDARIEGLKDEDLATLIYTSGTTGPPKGVMLTHKNLAWTADCALQLVQVGPQDCSLSYLPLSHIAEQMFTLHVPVTSGSQVYFAESLEKLKDNLGEVQPSVLFAVPRIWEKFHAALNQGLAAAPPLRKKIAAWAMSVGKRVHALRNQGQQESGFLALQYRIASRLVYSKLKPKLGLARARYCVSGAAPISAEIIDFFMGLDVPIREVYGQSEDTGPTSFNKPGRTRIGSVGPALPGVEVKIAEDGEICVRGPNVFAGYYKDAAASAEALVDGWLHSGDLGRFDEDGYLHITGRKKDIIITAGGKNITPKNIETAIKDCPVVGEAVVVGDRRPYLVALVSLDAEALPKWAQDRGKDPAKAHADDGLRAEIQSWLDQRVNTELARVEQIKKFAILEKPLSIDGGELTPTLKVKRNVVATKYADLIDGLYAGGGDA